MIARLLPPAIAIALAAGCAVATPSAPKPGLPGQPGAAPPNFDGLWQFEPAGGQGTCFDHAWRIKTNGTTATVTSEFKIAYGHG